MKTPTTITSKITTISSKILILKAAIKLSGEWVAVNQLATEEAIKILTPMGAIMDSRTHKVTWIPMISSLPERAEAVEEGFPIRYIPHKISFRLVEDLLADRAEGSLFMSNMILIKQTQLIASNNRLMSKINLHLLHTFNPR